MKRPYAIAACLACLGLAGPLRAQQEAPGTITSIRVANIPGTPVFTFAAAATVNAGSPPRAGESTVGAGGLTFDQRGMLYITPYNSIRLPDSTLTPRFLTVFSTSFTDFGDGLPAQSRGFVRSAGADASDLGVPLTLGIVSDLVGNIYIASSYDQRIRRVNPDGLIWTVAGSGDLEHIQNPSENRYIVRGGYSGDGGLATQAQLDKPCDVALDMQGNLYIADFRNGRIRLVNREGFISTFAGNGGKATDPLGDGGSAIVAVLVTPVSVAVDLKGNVYVAELFAHRVRKIAPDDQHTITTFAGTGEKGFSGDGGPATQARLNNPIGLAVDWAGNVYIADRDNHRIRKVDPNGIITTFAGNGLPGFSGDEGPATQARVEYPRDLAIDPKGYLYISHDVSQGGPFYTGRVRKVAPLKPLEVPSIRLSATSMAFEATQVNTAMEQTLTISNAGKETPLLVEVATDKYAPEWRIVSQTNFLVQPGESQTVRVRYTPTSLRSTSARLLVYHSGAEEKPLTVTLNAVPGTTKSADFDGDGKVGFDDFFLFAGAFGGSGTGENAKFDLDGSGKIDFDDFFLFAGRFGR